MHRLLAEPELAGFVRLFGSTVVKAAVDDVLREARVRAARADAPPADLAAILARVRARLARVEADGLVPVLNGTGILLHTNLGRAPLSRAATEAIAEIGRDYSNLEFDLDAGNRGSRYSRVTELLRATTGAQDGLVVNNCAAAMLLVLDTFARAPGGSAAREVVVARSGLIEIGGGLRLPDVLARSGADLVEVGTANKVYLADFERATTARTALYLIAHPSNVRVEGFVADVGGAELGRLGKRLGVPVLEDLGSGALVDLQPYGLPHERTAREAIADGVDLVAFSGDKLLGGPQAGIIVGSASAIARLRANPLLRALRVDKSTLAALAATLRAYIQPDGIKAIPFYAMLGATVDSLRVRADALSANLRASRDFPAHASVATVDSLAYAGGGSAPGATLPSIAIALRCTAVSANDLCARLRAQPPRVIARADGDAALVDLRTIAPDRDADLEMALRRSLA
jgi:L-seryl-tRNA(Ser) seleniumtransferase